MIRTLFVTIFFIQALLGRGQNIFFEKYPETENKIWETYNQLSILYARGEEGKLIYSMAAPEIAVYDIFLDKIETKASEIFYVNLGGEYANFSIGMFQMKPLFAEKIEMIYLSLKIPDKIDFSYSDTSASEIRYHRIKRLKDTEWQQKYLIACYEILNVKYGKRFSDPEKKIRFFAAAYNYGFDAPETEIKNWEKNISFPGRFDKPVVAYAELAFSVWKLLSGKIETDKIPVNTKESEEMANRDSLKMNKAGNENNQINSLPDKKFKSYSKTHKRKKYNPMIPAGILILLICFFFFIRSRRQNL